MRLRIAVLALAVAAVLAAPPGVYHADPAHLWNRLHDALFLRTYADGQEYGRDRVEPLLWSRSQHLLGGESHQRLLSVLTEFNRGGAALVADPLERAMLQRDLWLVFNWLEHDHDDFYGFPGDKAGWRARQDALRRPLARAIGALALSPRQIAALPDTYAAAAASRAFADRFDPRQPDRPYLPPDLFAADGPWTCLGRGDELIAPAHVVADNPFTTSAFLIFIKLPGGRAATRDYVARLSAFNGPLFVSTPFKRAPEFPNYNPAIPQFPEGTEVALVRRALLVTSTFEVVASPLVETVQVRVYRRVPPWTPETMMRAGLVTDEVRSSQAFFEFVVSRRLLFAGRSGGLRATAPGDLDFLTGFDPRQRSVRPGARRRRLAGDGGAAVSGVPPSVGAHPRANSRWRTEKSPPQPAPGVFSFHTYTRCRRSTGSAGGRRAAGLLTSAVACGSGRVSTGFCSSCRLREPATPGRFLTAAEGAARDLTPRVVIVV